MACTCKVGPGKFEGEGALTFLAYMHLGMSDVSTFEGDIETEWFRAPLDFDADVEALNDARAYGYCAECIEAASGGEPEGIMGGVALTEDNNGFVYLARFETREDFDAALDEAQEAEAAEADEE